MGFVSFFDLEMKKQMGFKKTKPVLVCPVEGVVACGFGVHMRTREDLIRLNMGRCK